MLPTFPTESLKLYSNEPIGKIVGFKSSIALSVILRAEFSTYFFLISVIVTQVCLPF